MADNRKFLQTQKHTLSASISLSDTSIALSSFNMPDGTAIVAGDLGSINYATIEPGTTREESISFTGLTSTTLTGVTRGLRFDAPYTQDTSLRVAHGAGAVLVLSNTVSFYDNFVNKNNDETYAETLTFTAPNYPKMDSVANDPTDDEQLATKDYVDKTAGGAAVSKNREVVAGNAGETVAAGNWVRLDPADSEWKKTDGSVTGTTDKIKIGVAQGAGTDGAAISGGVLLSGLDSNQTGMTANTTQFISDTAGEISSSAGTVERAVGIAISTTEIIVDPYFADYVIADQVDALTGSSGTPSSTNTYITEDDVSDAAGSGKVVRASGTALPALDGSNLTNIPSGTSKITSTTTNVVISTNAETDIFSATIPANSLGTADIIRGKINFTGWGIDVSKTFTLRFKYGSTTMSTGSFTPGFNSSTELGWVDFEIFGAGATNSQESFIKFRSLKILATGVPNLAVEANRFIISSGTAAEDSTGALTLAVSAQWDVTGTNGGMTTVQSYAELIKV